MANPSKIQEIHVYLHSGGVHVWTSVYEHFLYGGFFKVKYYVDIAPHFTEVATCVGVMHPTYSVYVGSMYNCVHSQILNTACTVHLYNIILSKVHTNYKLSFWNSVCIGYQ